MAKAKIREKVQHFFLFMFKLFVTHHINIYNPARPNVRPSRSPENEHCMYIHVLCTKKWTIGPNTTVREPVIKPFAKLLSFAVLARRVPVFRIQLEVYSWNPGSSS